MAAHRLRILRWMNLRFFTGFSEWLSNVFYDEDLTALLSLVDFCEDDDLRTRAAILVDLILLARHDWVQWALCAFLHLAWVVAILVPAVRG